MRGAVGVLGMVLAGCGFTAPPSLSVDGDGTADDARPIDGSAIDGDLDGSTDGMPGDGVMIDAAVDAAPDAVPDAPANLQRRLMITIPVGQAGATSIPTFPVWVDVTHNDLKAALADPAQFYFQTNGGADQAFEIVSWDPATGHLRAWVRTTIGASNSVLYLYYNALVPGHAAAPATVFSSSFAAVWHLDGNPSTPVPDTRGPNTGTTEGMTATDSVAGKLFMGFDFDGADDGISIPNPATGTGEFTISAWVFPRAQVSPSYGSVISLGSATGGAARFLHTAYPKLGVGFYGDDWQPNTALAANQWSLVHWVFHANRMSDLYVNGTLIGNHQHGSIATAGATGFIGRSPPVFNAGGELNRFNGVLDEVRIATTARDLAWVTAEVKNQTNPTTFAVPATTSEAVP